MTKETMSTATFIEEGFGDNFMRLDTLYDDWLDEGKELADVEEKLLRDGYKEFLTRVGFLMPNGKIKRG